MYGQDKLGNVVWSSHKAMWRCQITHVFM